MKKIGNRFDIRHKETLTLFLREYFELFFPDLAAKMRFETARFLDKELIALFEQDGEDELSGEDRQRITDALILVNIFLDGVEEQAMIHWEQQGEKQRDFNQRMFHSFCGVFFKFKKPIFPIAMFTDSAKWRKPVKDTYTISLGGYPINEFTYRLIKLKHIPAAEFEEKAATNPLAAAYLPLTDYPKKDRPLIKAKAIKGIAGVENGPKRSVLYSLIQQSLELDPDEEKKFKEIIGENHKFKEAKMLQSIEEVGMERGIDIGMEKGIDIGKKEGRKEGKKETARNLLLLNILTEEQIAQATNLSIEEVRRLKREAKTPRRH
jgi:hypothetical protein